MDKVTLVTGGSRGIGAATAKACAAAGHKVAVNYVNGNDAAEAVVAAIEAAGGTAMAVRADMANEAEIVTMFETVEAELGPITGLVNNAGINGGQARVDELTDAAIAEVLNINVRGCFLCAREAVKRMSTRHGGHGGAIVNISSGSAKLGNPGSGVLYAASKGAVNSLTIGLSQEVGGEGIRVNAVAPGLTETDMPAREKLDGAVNTVPMGRAAEPEEIAAAILFLLSDDASYVAGANLRVGGGRL
ncbi:MAG: SDR family oxidoreductase [Rhodospirillaceae bacterium]|jgi:NAD(P)-dependent dehydrogenase (short-subunit alcohol dehydrogenase family)|nr:SDR family oxidoreductase [Rhodospirillaceae bacterium]